MTSVFPQQQPVAISDADPIAAIMSSFRRGSALVDRAVAALVTVAAVLERIQAKDEQGCARAMLDLWAAIESAGLEGDNLLVARSGRAEPQAFVIFTLSRQKTGAFAIQPVEIDRGPLALASTDEIAAASFHSRLVEAVEARPRADDHITQTTETAARAMAQAAASASSRLSIVKARLDLQSTFLTAILDAETTSPLVRLDSHLNQAGAREMAMATRRMLGRQSLNIANSNRRTLEALLQPHLSSLA